MPPGSVSTAQSLGVYLPLNTATMRRAAELWAEARLRGQPTAPEHALDGDVILAAQALEVSGTVVTMNPRHLGRYVAVESWIDIEAGVVEAVAHR